MGDRITYKQVLVGKSFICQWHVRMNMRKDQIFVLMLVILLPMSGCFDGAVGDAEAEDDSDGTTIINNYYNNSTASQERVWYSTADDVNKYWNDGQDIASGSQRCLEFGPSYDSETGEYLGEECKEMAYPSSLSDWNGSDCDGVLIETGSSFATNPRFAPECQVVATIINTGAGEALILYEMQSIKITTICDGILASTITSVNSYYGGEGHRIVTGSAMDCSHEVSYTQTYLQSSSSSLNDMKILSLVYAIQDTVVVWT